jgi:hypothetical protein
VPYYWYDNASGTWKLQPGAPDPAQVINFSRGNDATYDDSIGAQEWDATVDSYGVTATVAAGNSGPASRTVNDPALAYNVIGVGAFSGGGTTDPADDSVFAWSSRGPTVGERKKPDLVAVGDGGLADSYYQSTGKLWNYDTGTSYAAPQVGGGAILLAGAGIRDPKVVKAILINSARPGRATSSAPMGTQVGWLPDWGWGEMNLDAAYHERLNFDRGQVPANSARFFRATAQATGDRATLVWNRRVADCQPLRQGCYYDTSSGFRVYTLSNLDLAEYDAATDMSLASSTSGVDNVEQVRAPAAGNVVYKVSAGDVDGPAGESFAIAATRPLTALVTPQPNVSVTVEPRGPVRAGDPVRVDATIANPSPDLTAGDAQVTLNVPLGVELVAGQQTQALGTLQPKGTPGDTRNVSWIVRGSSTGLKQLIAGATAIRYGSTFRSSATGSFTVDAEPPRVTLASPAGTISDPGIPVSWSGTDDGAGVSSYDVQVAPNGGPFTPWLTATTQTSGTYAGSRGSRYRFRARATDAFGNTSDYVTTPDVVIEPGGGPTGPNPPSRDPLPTDGGTALRSPELRITAIRQARARLVVRGTVARAANGKVTALWTARVHGRRYVVRVSTYAQLRSYRLVLTIPRPARAAKRATVSVHYRGGEGFATQTRRTALRSR